VSVDGVCRRWLVCCVGCYGVSVDGVESVDGGSSVV